MDFDLKNKTALITGATDGFGKALVKLLASEGANVIIHDLPFKDKIEKAEQLCKEIVEEYGVKANAVYGNLQIEEDVHKIYNQAKAITDIDILINNAAIWPTAYVVEMTSEDFRKTLDINLIAPFILCREMVNDLIRKNKKGKIVNMVSQAAFNGSTSGHAHYAASKAGLVGFTISLAREVAKNGINVNCVAPGMMRTPMNKEALEEREDEYLKRIPLERIADPVEVANAVAFLCSNKSDYMTGTTLDVTGGMLMR